MVCHLPDCLYVICVLPSDSSSQILCAVGSLVGQTFAAHGGRGKERLVTIDRFLWHGGIENRDITTRKDVSAPLFCDVGDQQ